MSTQHKTIVFISGANSGIGFETVKAFAQSSRAYHVFFGSRSVDKGQKAIDALTQEFPDSSTVLELVQVDVSRDESIDAAHEIVKKGPGYLDVLINNAGHSIENQVPMGLITMREAWNQMFDVNVTGAQILTEKFVPFLLKSKDPRLIFLTSGLAQVETLGNSYYPGPPPKAGWPKTDYLSPDGYRTSKVALNMMMLTWYWCLKEDGVKVWSLSPGWLATNLGGRPEKLKAAGAGDPAIGGNLVKQVVEGERDGEVGKVVALKGVQPF